MRKFFLFLLILGLSCTKEPNKPEDLPQKVDCPNGFLPCEIDSTTCCEVICPPGTLLGGQDSTECIPVVCPEYYYLCGEDSTDCCLEITSHEIAWKVDTIFNGSLNWVYDVAIINDTTIWVVGEFELDDPEDTLTHFEGRFNLIVWDGEKWELRRATLPEWSTIPRLQSIFSTQNSDIWVGGYGPMHWNGIEWNAFGPDEWPTFDNSGGCITIWGSDRDDVFFGSINGQINHWDGSGFSRMETPTDVRLTDIHGTGYNDVWAVGYDGTTGSTTLIHYNGIGWSLMYEGDVIDWYAFRADSISGVIHSVYAFEPGQVHILANPHGIYTTTVSTVPHADFINVEENNHWLGYINGNHSNDMFICGSKSGVFHYNGESVKLYELPGQIYSVAIDVKDNLVVMIGEDTQASGAFAIIGNK